DRFGRKKSYFFGTLIMTIMPVVYMLFEGPISNFYTPLFAIRIVHGIGVALGFTASFTYIADICPPQRLNEGIGMFGITALVGMAVGPGISEPIIHNFGFEAYFFIVSILGAIALVLELFLPETYFLQSFQGRQISFFSVLIRKKIFGIALVAMLFGVGLAAQGGFVSPYVEDLKLPNVTVFFVAYSMAAILTRFFGVRIADRTGEIKIIPFALAINALGYLLLIAVKNPLVLIFSGIVTGCGHGFLFPCLNSLIIRDEPVHIRGKINGVFTGGIDLGLFLGSIFLGYIGEWFGYRPIFFSTFLILITGLGTFFVLLKTDFLPHDRQI
ncbi:MAG: MFS transporter, partial [Desulfobacterales bacterium]